MIVPPATHVNQLYDSAALRALEAQAQARSGDAFTLMARAGQAAWRELLRLWPEALKIAVLCGPGNNGGDGYVLARHAQQAGRGVRVLRLAGHAPRTAQAQRAERDYLDAGGAIEESGGAIGDADLVVDALFGIGLQRPPEGAAAALVAAVNAGGAPVFALDVPSGVDADRGNVPGVAIRAMHTLQFIAAHAGLHTGVALAHTGSLAVAGLGLPPELLAGVAPVARRLDASMLAQALAPRARHAHKGHSGHVLCVGGDHGMGGAILLAAEAALRCGAGLVSVATRAGHVPPLLARRAEAMAHAVEAGADVAPLLDRADVVAIGPGLGQGEWGRALLAAGLASRRALVIDADALNLVATDGAALPADAVITPHPGEAARLLQCPTAEVQADRYVAAGRLCERFGCVVVLKGAGTVVVAPGELPQVVAAGNPGMAVAGMGDVLTGCIASLRAQGLPAFDAARFGALLHAAAEDVAALQGERGLLPSDLFVPLRTLVNGRPGA